MKTLLKPQNLYLTRLESLNPGETFEIPGLEDSHQNGVFLFSTPAASRVIIDILDQYKNSWDRNSREYLANSVMVRVMGKINVTKGTGGIIEVEGRTREDKKEKKIRKEQEKDQKKELKVLGRAEKIEKREERKKVLAQLKQEKGLAREERKKARGEQAKEKQSVKAAAPGKRGRKKKESNIVFPAGKWTVAQVAALNKVEKYTITNEMGRLRLSGKTFTEAGIVEKKEKTRGKPEKWWKIK